MFVCIVICLVSLTACGEDGYPVEVAGVTVKKAPEQVVALSESAASVIMALGYEGTLVAAPQSYQKQTGAAVQVAGTTTAPNLEVLKNLPADLILSGEGLSYTAAQQLQNDGREVVQLAAPQQYAELLPYYTNIARIFAGEEKGAEQAATYIAQLESSLAEMKTANAAKTGSVLFYLEDGFAATGETLPGQLLEKAGFQNAAAALQGYSITDEQVKTAAPQYIFCPTGMGETLLKNTALKDVPAIASGKVYEVNTGEVVYGGAQVLSVLGSMANYMQ